ncbi:hypothetical protein ACPV5O_25480 [Vibrio maritimus]|uniref:hypothetical protein n=1 Tax=Vibrio maritimus TaxID=990268 RepID=UPI004067C10B
MSSFNKIRTNQKLIIKETLKTSLVGYKNQAGLQATFNDVAWQYTFPNGQYINISFADSSKATDKTKGVRFGYIQEKYKLEKPKRLIMIAYTFDVIAQGVSNETKRGKLRACRNIMSVIDCELSELNQRKINEILNGLNSTSARYKRSFLKWLDSKRLIPVNLKLIPLSDSQDGYDRIDTIKEKMPDEKCLAALGAIFHEVIPDDREKWNLSFVKQRRYEFACSMSVLALASPNRVAAEQITLVNQEIKSMSVNGETINWLDWQGSKGYKDSQNHLLSSIIRPVTTALEYIRKITEPARILARFYENPSAPLKNLLGEYHPPSSRLRQSKCYMNKPVNLLQLGYLLGYVDEKLMVITPKETVGSVKARNKRYHRKHIHLLKPEDLIYLRENTSAHSIFGAGMKQDDINRIVECNASKYAISVEQLQNKWIKHIYQSIPTFPYCIMDSGNKVKFSSMMFAFTGRQFMDARSKGGSNGIGTCSWFYLVTGKRLSTAFSTMLGSKNERSKVIFKDFGFSNSFRLTPNQFRHWLTDTGERAGISRNLLNLWGGRVSAEHIFSYLHSSDDKRSSVVRDIVFKDEQKEDSGISIKVYSQKDYARITGISDGVSSFTSTGFCIQNLVTSPCEYMNNFETQCTLCPYSCHVKGDSNALELLEKDLEYQLLRIEKITNSPNFTKSTNLQNWFKVHHRNTEMLKELIRTMMSKNVAVGSVIRVLQSLSEIRITNVRLKIVTTKKLSLASSKTALEKTIDDLTKDEGNEFSELISILREL